MKDLDTPFKKGAHPSVGRPRKHQKQFHNKRENFSDIQKEVWIQMIITLVNILYWNRLNDTNYKGHIDNYKTSKKQKLMYDKFTKIRKEFVTYLESL